MFKKIIVAVDFSPLSQRAMRTAASLAKQLSGAEVVLVHVIVRGTTHLDPAHSTESVREGIEEQLTVQARELAREHGVRVDWGVVDGSTADELAAFAERWGGDLLVAGTHAREGVTRLLFGTVLDHLMHIARVPVLLVGPGVD